MTNNDPYKLLAERLDALPNGFPPTDDGTELRLLALIFTPEEAALAAQLRAINPLAVLDRGYSITMRPDGRVLKSGAGLRAGDRLMTRFARDAVESEVMNHVSLEKPGQAAGL